MPNPDEAVSSKKSGDDGATAVLLFMALKSIQPQEMCVLP
jgi:hypothetical protein